jgi:thiol-disulfide isomerase/thioredoxin
MRQLGLAVLLLCGAIPAAAQENSGGPVSDKAQKTYREGMNYLQKHMQQAALDSFKKADRQDDGRCLLCQKQIIHCGIQVGDWKAAEKAAEAMVSESQGASDAAVAHYDLGVVLLREGKEKHKNEFFERAHDEMKAALAANPSFPDACFFDGEALAYLKQDDAAKAQFARFVKMKPADDPVRRRALRFTERPDLARSRMAPLFTLTTLDGRSISMDSLQGKVVLLDFWATWCAPCREALPHMREIAKKFQEQPLVILSVSLDGDEQKWKDFVQKNGMTWPQYRDGGFTGPISSLFGVQAIPHTFTIDADGVLQDEHVGDAAIEGRLKKLVANARELQEANVKVQ